MVECEILISGPLALSLAIDDRVLVLPPEDGEPGVVLGLIKRALPVNMQTVTLKATQSLTVECGESSINLRADGKVIIRGEKTFWCVPRAPSAFVLAPCRSTDRRLKTWQ